MKKDGLIRKIWIFPKSITSQPSKDTVAVHIWPNISRSKGNLTRIIYQLIKYNLRSIFLKNHSQNLVEKLFQDPFLKTKIEHISGTIV